MKDGAPVPAPGAPAQRVAAPMPSPAAAPVPAPAPPPPRLRRELRFDWRDGPEGPFVVVEDPLGGGFFELDLAAAEFLRLLDGRTPEMAWRRLQGTSLGPDLPQDAVEPLVAEAGRMGLLQSTESGPPKRAKRPRVGLVSQRIPLGSHDRFFARAAGACGFLFGPLGWALWLGATIWGAVALIGGWETFRAELGALFTASSALLFLVAWLLSKVWHELQHGIVARRHGIEVREVGVMLIMFLPLGAYVDVSGVWRLADRWKRLHITAAGIMGELALGGVALGLWAAADPGLWRTFLQALAVTSTVSAVLFNINPLMRFDGYHALVDLTGIPNLYQRGAESVSRSWLRLFAGRGAVRETERPGIALYGWASLGWRLMLAATLTALAASLAFGFGLALGAAAVWGMIAAPLGRWLKRLWGLGRRARWTAALRGAAAAGLAAGLWHLPAPQSTHAPAIVDYRDAAEARAGADGMVTEVRVRAGQRVAEGETLLVLENPALLAERRRLLAEAGRAHVEAAQGLAAGAPAQAREAQGRAAVLGAELAEVETRLAGLSVRAPRAGVVLSARPQTLQGVWAKRGEALLEIADPETMEARAWLSPEAADRLLADGRDGGNDGGEADAEYAFRPEAPGAASTPLRLVRVAPSASDAPPPEAVTAQAGGPLDLVIGGETPRLAQVRVEARFAPLDQGFGPAAAPGARGRLETPRRWRPLGETAMAWLEGFDVADPAGWAARMAGVQPAGAQPAGGTR